MTAEMASNEPNGDDYVLEHIEDDHPVCERSFMTCAAFRLRAGQEVDRANVATILRDVIAAGECTRPLRLQWSPKLGRRKPLLLDTVITEHGGYGVAFALVAHFAGLRVVNVTQRGDRFDFFLTDGDEEFGLEVSGTVQSNLESRHKGKVEQLLQNPFGYNGYVVVVHFANRVAIFSYHSCEDM